MLKILSILLVFIGFFSCQMEDAQVLSDIDAVRDSLKNQYAPDKRIARFEIALELKERSLIVSGQSTEPIADEALLSFLASTPFKIENQIQSLPDAGVGETKYAVINNSVGNIRTNPKHSAELTTQALLGTEVKILHKDEEWYLIQTPDKYIAWIDHGGVQLMNDDEIQAWRASEKVIVTAVNSSISDESIVGDVVLGCTLKLIGERKNDFYVEYPDGRRGWLDKSNAEVFDIWKNDTIASGDLLEIYANQMIGVPYLWGGTSVKGLDCSGFTKTLYFMNGMVIPRDANQQMDVGEAVETGEGFENLEKGDLVFFGKAATDSTKQRITHVGLWLDDNKFIHASQRVRISSFDPESEYFDEFNLNRFRGARRYLQKSTDGIRVL